MKNTETVEVKLDAGAEIVSFNTRASEISGYAPGEVIGKNWFKIFIQPKDLVAVLKVFEDVFLGKNMHWEFENKIRTKDGKSIPMHWQNEMLLDERGRRQYIYSKGTPIPDKE
jgi:PAS domain S-box-containing protein